MGKLGLALAIIFLVVLITYGAQVGQAVNTIGTFFGFADLLNKLTNNNIGSVGGSSQSAVTAAKNLEPVVTSGVPVCDLKIQLQPIITQPYTAFTVSFVTIINPDKVEYSWVNCNTSGQPSTASLLSFLTPTNPITYTPKLDVGVNGLNTFHYYITLTDQSAHSYSYVARPELVQSVNINSGTFASDVTPTLVYYIKGIPHVPYTATITSDLPTLQTPANPTFQNAVVGTPITVQIGLANKSVSTNCFLGIFC